MRDKGHISEKNRNYLLVDHSKAGRFYLLPKIHKAGSPGRPIVSANGHPTEKISEFVDLHLQPHVQNLPSCLKATTDFLRKQDAQAPFPPDTLLVSMDVTSLYTNIPHQDGIQACEEVWEERKVKDPSTQTLVKLLTLILKCNTSCKTTNVVYLITCTKCGKQYVGETDDHVNQRMNGHRDDWKHKRFERSPVAEHFCSPEHDFLNHATLCCLDHNPEWTDRTRKARESYWIRRLNTLRPHGINKDDQ